MGNCPQTNALITTQKIASTMSVLRVLVVAIVFAIAVSSASGKKSHNQGWGQQQSSGFDIGGIFQKKIQAKKGFLGKIFAAKKKIIGKILSPLIALKSKKAKLVGKLLAPKIVSSGRSSANSPQRSHLPLHRAGTRCNTCCIPKPNQCRHTVCLPVCLLV